MVDSLKKPAFDEIRPGVKSPAKETILTPRFYTTDFEEMEKMDISVNEEELLAILEEFRVDYNRHHFVRDAQFDQSWDHIDGDTRGLFIEFLERSCTAEFSGFLLYKELSRRLKGKSPVLAECFELMSRDEARHAGFLNKAMSDFNLSLDLGFLTKNHQYTFFKPKFIFYATYLSEKIGYWRYITIYRHLEAHPESRIYPIFRFFENWCQDENRHGDFFDAIMQSQPQMLNDWKAKLWCRFFLLSVFATMYLNDLQRADFYACLGLNARDYDIHVIEKTNQTAGRVFPVMLDVSNPEFYNRLDVCVQNNQQLSAITNSGSPKLVQFFQKLPYYLSNGWQLGKLYFMKPIDLTGSQGAVY
ncbi:Magnesium-protoporphyrin IX monomethyl ester (oxidative) cyclase 3 [Planktothrix sp. PCC 11201]|uniref:magnesium-protoporphyrin IX monomethyl ester (oxidative) cyclase n=1 Tax=Planktothrix sp. PCC 11201 TaxID=1729650 RepID=UPI0009245835|nr:magnesium-protoporphyrin IX monomethyl ester (oxidative) cyclase [Planktothrix sp. PCC 11201]SKB15807.1 Magnesium-protoporphyrin IX monomethyl ester (oxidative) cyclase 3 [Planktothrix sp. PCC 11201]